MPNTRVIDLSHHNEVPKDFTAAAAAGVWGVIHKLSEGDNYTDSKVSSRHYLARQAGLNWGVYHFVRPGDMLEQADYFLAQGRKLEVIDDDTLVALDYEDAGVSLADCITFMDRLDYEIGRSCVLYSGHVLKDAIAAGQDPGSLTKRRLWLAQYTSGKPTLPTGWDRYFLWQWSDEGDVPGINPPTDVNDYQGTVEELRQEWVGRSAAPEPSDDLVVRVVVPRGVEVVIEKAPKTAMAKRVKKL